MPASAIEGMRSHYRKGSLSIKEYLILAGIHHSRGRSPGGCTPGTGTGRVGSAVGRMATTGRELAWAGVIG